MLTVGSFTLAGRKVHLLDRDGAPWLYLDEVGLMLGVKSNRRPALLRGLADDERDFMEGFDGRPIHILSADGALRVAEVRPGAAADALAAWIDGEVVPGFRAAAGKAGDTGDGGGEVGRRVRDARERAAKARKALARHAKATEGLRLVKARGNRLFYRRVDGAGPGAGSG